MESNFNRRQWLKTTAFLSAGLMVIPRAFSANGKVMHTQKSLLKNPEDFKAEDLAAYETTPEDLKARLMYNENPFGPSKKALKAINETAPEGFQYPFMESEKLKARIAEYERLKPENVAVSNGSSPYLMAGAFLFGKGKILSSQPSYEDLLSRAEAMGSTVIRVPLTSDFKYDLDAIEKQVDDNTSLIYICNPNNPTATIVDPDKLKSFCKRLSKKTMIMVDEAYIDICKNPEGITLMGLVRDGYNIIVVRTFSKLYGLAGMRIGYIVGQPDTIKKMVGYTTDTLALATTSVAAAMASYQDHNFLNYAAAHIEESKQFLYETLKSEGYSYVPSNTNFLIFPVRENSEKFVRDMLDKGVGVRSWHFIGKEWCRVSIGTMDQMKIFATALHTI